MPKLENMLKGRNADNIEDYFFVCHYFVRRVMGCSEYDKHQKTGGGFSTKATSSDEAFTLAVLENNYEKWCFKLSGSVPGEGETVPIPKFTRRKGKKAIRFQGWSWEGLKAFGDIDKEYLKMRN
jgi:hypothetical protein